MLMLLALKFAKWERKLRGKSRSWNGYHLEIQIRIQIQLLTRLEFFSSHEENYSLSFLKLDSWTTPKMINLCLCWCYYYVFKAWVNPFQIFCHILWLSYILNILALLRKCIIFSTSFLTLKSREPPIFCLLGLPFSDTNLRALISCF